MQAAPRAKGGRGRGRGGRGRGRGSRGRRGGRSYRRGRSQTLDEDLEDSDSEGGAYPEPELPVVTPAKHDELAVEQIYGWRWSLPLEDPVTPLYAATSLALMPKQRSTHSISCLPECASILSTALKLAHLHTQVQHCLNLLEGLSH